MSFTDQKPVGTMRNLCEAMGIEFHDCRYEQCELATRPTDPALCWRALQYMMGRGDWARFVSWVEDSWLYETRELWMSDYIKWLLSATYTDEDGQTKLLFVKLANEWCRKHPEEAQ